MRNYYPLTAAQKMHHNWIMDYGTQQVSGVSVVASVQAELDFGLLKKCIQMETERSGCTRVRFTKPDKDGNVKQYIEKQDSRDIELKDLSGMESLAKADELMQQWAYETFDGDNIPMCEFIMLKLPEGYNGFFLHMDHRLIDSCGLVVMIEDLFQLYTHYRYGTACPQELVDFETVLKKDLAKAGNEKRFAKDKKFWDDQLDALGEPLYSDIQGPSVLEGARKRHGDPKLRASDIEMNELFVAVKDYHLEPYATQNLMDFCICINDSLLHMVRNMSIFKPDIMLMVPMMIETIYKRLAAADPQIPKAVLAEKVFGGKLQTIFTGGAHLDPYYIDRFAEYGVQILEGYGMSECSPVISNNTPENHKPGSIGRPLENVEIRFENGEILVKGTSVMKGYYQMPDETAETLKDGWLHTGDKGYMDEDGYLFINGRVKNLIILSNGENVSPEEIENKLALNPLVGEVIVTGEDNGLTARIYPEQAVVEAKALDTEMIRSQLQEFLDEYNKNQPTYRRITGLVIRKNPFIRSTTKKIRRQDVLIDEPQA